jgi:hypothetical protein
VVGSYCPSKDARDWLVNVLMRQLGLPFWGSHTMLRALSVSGVIVLYASVVPVCAAPLHDYDMASLWYLSEVVVEGEELGYSEWNSSWLVGNLRVTRVHKGPETLGEGDEIPVATELAISRKPLFSGPLDATGVETKQVLLFLQWNQQETAYRPGERYLLVASGLKLIVDADDVVYRLEQGMNPGPYELMRQGPELVDRSELKMREVTAEIEAEKEKFPGYWESQAYVYGRSALRRDLDLAAKHVDRFQEALDAGNLDALEQFLPSSLPMAAWSMQDGVPLLRTGYRNALASAAATEFARHADAARISAVLDRHSHQLTYDVRYVLERALAGERPAAR